MNENTTVEQAAAQEPPTFSELYKGLSDLYCKACGINRARLSDAEREKLREFNEFAQNWCYSVEDDKTIVIS